MATVPPSFLQAIANPPNVVGAFLVGREKRRQIERQENQDAQSLISQQIVDQLRQAQVGQVEANTSLALDEPQREAAKKAQEQAELLAEKQKAIAAFENVRDKFEPGVFAAIQAQIESAPDKETLFQFREDMIKGQLPNQGRNAIPSQLATFNALTAELSPEDLQVAKRVQLGLEPRAVGSANITTAQDPELTAQVAESQSTIKEATKFAEMTGASRVKAIDSGIETIADLDLNIRNLDEAIAAIDEGASTGAIESRFFASTRESTVKLEQIQAKLGLDVVGATTFGALSKGELDLALQTALPDKLQPDALREWLVARKVAQSKLRDYYAEQIEHLDSGGSVASFLRKKDREKKGVVTIDPAETQAAIDEL